MHRCLGFLAFYFVSEKQVIREVQATRLTLANSREPMYHATAANNQGTFVIKAMSNLMSYYHCYSAIVQRPEDTRLPLVQ